jgi:arginase family enzyme
MLLCGSGRSALALGARRALHVLHVPYQPTSVGPSGAADSEPLDLESALASSRRFDFNRGAPNITLEPADPKFREWNRKATAKASQLAAAVDEGDAADAVRIVDEYSGLVTDQVYRHTRRLLAAGAVPAVVGGDRTAAFGAIAAAAESHPFVGLLQLSPDLGLASEGAHPSEPPFPFPFRLSHSNALARVLGPAAPAADADANDASAADVAAVVAPGLGVTRAACIGARGLHEAEWQAARVRAAEGGGAFSVLSALEASWCEHNGAPWAQQLERLFDSLPAAVWVSVDVSA